MQFIRAFYAPNPGQGLPDLKNLQDLNQELANMRDTLTSVGEAFRRQLTAQINALPRSQRAAAKDFQNDFTGALDSINSSLKKTEREINANNKGLRNADSIERQLNEALDAQNQLQRSKVNLQSRGVTLSQRQVRQFDDANAAADDLVKYLQRQLDIQRKQEKQMGVFKDMITGIGKIPILGSLINAPKILQDMEKAASKGASKTKQFMVGLDSMFKNIGSGLISGALGLLTTVLTFAVKSVIEFDKKSFEIAKNLGITNSEAKKVQGTFNAIALSSRNIALTSMEIAKTYGEISNELGFLAPQNRAFSETMTLVQRRLGLSAQDMGTLATQSALTGKSLMDTYRTLQATRVVEGARNKLSLSAKQIIEAISKVSSNVLVNFKGSDTALQAAVIRAAKLGTNLETVNKQAQSLVDFESSIEAEFEAQVLTGRNINLTRARELALLGKTAELMEELNKQNVTLKEYQEMTSIEKDAFAKALGKTSEELSKQLIEQEKATKLGAEQGVSLQQQYDKLIAQKKSREEIASIIGAEAEADLAKASRAEKFQATIERLKDTLGAMLEGPVGRLVDKFTAFVNDGEKMRKLGEALKSIFTGIEGVIKKFPQILSSAVQVAKVLASLAVARAVASVVGSLSAVPVVGAAVGIAAGLRAYSWLSELVNSIGGGGGGAPSISTPSAPTGIEPLNQSAAAAKTVNGEEAKVEKKPPVFNFNVTAQIGSDNISRLTRTSISQDPGTTMV